jgi:spheroidene monooxygenase
MQAISLSFFRFDGLSDRIWAFTQMQAARGPFGRIPNIGFHKMLGTGTGRGFTPWPNWGVYALMAAWPSPEVARERVADAAVYKAYKARSAEHWTVFLNATRSRGEWAGGAPFEPLTEVPGQEGSAVAVLTRASVKPRHVPAFWSRVPDIQRVLPVDDPGLLFRMGLGEIPWLHQVTFSIWTDLEAMEEFAYRGPHHAAVREVYREGWFSEELFARFRVLGTDGTWDGRDPISDATLFWTPGRLAAE